MKRPVTTFERFLDAQDEQALYLLWKDAKMDKNGEEAQTADVTNGEVRNKEVKNGGNEDLLNSSQNGTANVLLGYLKVKFQFFGLFYVGWLINCHKL